MAIGSDSTVLTAPDSSTAVRAEVRAEVPERRVTRRTAGLAVVVAGFVVATLGYLAAGVRFDASAITSARSGNQMQLLDTQLLAHHLLQSLWYLDSQPPLYNLFCGVLLHLPAGARVPVAAGCFWLLGLAMVSCTYLLLVELDVPVWLAVAVSLVVIANPATVLYENWLSWSYPAATLLTVGTYCCARYLRTGRAGWGAGCFSCFGAVVLDDTTFQLVWLLVLLVLVGLVARLGWRKVLVAALVPMLVVVGWYAKNALVFGTYDTSTWLGMNLASTTIIPAPRGQVRSLVRQGRLTRLALVDPFAPVSDYEPKFVRVRPGDVAALAERRKSNGAVNLDDPVYAAVSSKYLHDDLSYIVDEPRTYARRVYLAAELWFVPSDQYVFLSANFDRISGYANLYDLVALGQLQPTNDWVWYFADQAGVSPTAGMLSYPAVAELVLAVVGGAVMAVRRRRERVVAGTAAVAVLTVLYSFAVTSLVSMGENERFRFELGTLPAVVAVAVVVWLVRGAWARWPAGPDRVRRRWRAPAVPGPGCSS